MCWSRLAPIRLVPFSYFWICWKVMPRLLAELLLAHSEHHATQPNPTSDMNVDRIWLFLIGHVASLFDRTGSGSCCSLSGSIGRYDRRFVIGARRSDLCQSPASHPVPVTDRVLSDIVR